MTGVGRIRRLSFDLQPADLDQFGLLPALLGLFERSEPDFSIVGVAADGLETIRLADRLKLDVVVLDLMMPGLSGLEALRVLRDRSPRTRIVILSMYSSSAFVAQALPNGAIGYVLEGCSEENLIRAVREAAIGRRFLSPPVTEIAINAYVEQSRGGLLSPYDTLTPRQREVLQMAAEGKTTSEDCGTPQHQSTDR